MSSCVMWIFSLQDFQAETEELLLGMVWDDEASQLLKKAGSVRTAIMMHKRKLSRAEAEARLAAAKGRLRIALGESAEKGTALRTK